MSTEKLTNTQEEKDLLSNSQENAPQPQAEIIPSMDDFKDEIDKSFKRVSPGDLLKGTVIGISDTELTLDLGYYTEAIIILEELSNDPNFSINTDVTLGEEISGVVISTDNGHGNILLSKKQADDILAWEKITEDLESKTNVKVKISQTVNGGVIAYLYGIRAFIPASQLSIAYVEDLESWVGKEIEARIITASEEDNKLVLSGKEVEIELADKERASIISKLTRGSVTTGTVEKIMPYGAFVNIGEGLSGLVHISQISQKRIKSPNEVIKEGETVTVMITDIRDGKISLSMKAVSENQEVVTDIEDGPSSYQSGEEATTNLGALLKNFKL